MGNLYRPVDHVVKAIQYTGPETAQEIKEALEPLGLSVNVMPRRTHHRLPTIQVSGKAHGGYDYVREYDRVVLTGEEYDIFTDSSFSWRYKAI